MDEIGRKLKSSDRTVRAQAATDFLNLFSDCTNALLKALSARKELSRHIEEGVAKRLTKGLSDQQKLILVRRAPAGSEVVFPYLGLDLKCVKEAFHSGPLSEVGQSAAMLLTVMELGHSSGVITVADPRFVNGGPGNPKSSGSGGSIHYREKTPAT